MYKILIFISLLATLPLLGQDDEAFYIKKIYNSTLTEGQAYDWLEYVCHRIGPRLSGTPQAAAAVEYTRQMLDTLGLDRVWLQPVEVPHWDRGEPEQVRIVNSSIIGTQVLKAVALGNSVGTGPQGITAEVVRVNGLKEVEELGTAGIKGKIVFYNRAFDQTHISTGHAYGGAVDQRGSGPSKAAQYGALAVIVRSMSSVLDDIPHSGALVYSPDQPQIPAVAISTKGANLLSSLLDQEKTRVYIRTTSRMLKPKPSYNVIGEIKGNKYPEEIILVGGHLDSWDLGQGAHDDGTGCVQSMEVLRQIRKIGYVPQRTIRCVLFMNEENGLKGGLEYAQKSNLNKEYHFAAIESDAGGFTPRGFGIGGESADQEVRLKLIMNWSNLLEPYGLTLTKGGGGADIGPLKSQKGFLIGFTPDSQRYFDIHHTAEDTFDKVNKRELHLGAAAMTALVYLLDKYGVGHADK